MTAIALMHEEHDCNPKSQHSNSHDDHHSNQKANLSHLQETKLQENETIIQTHASDKANDEEEKKQDWLMDAYSFEWHKHGDMNPHGALTAACFWQMVDT